MDRSSEGTKGEWMTVPAFGDWDMQKGMVPDYSLDFSKIREMRKQNKSDYSRISIGNDEELLHRSKEASAVSPSGAVVTPASNRQHAPPSVGRKKFMSYFVCCIRA